jgi:hypothetical protein
MYKNMNSKISAQNKRIETIAVKTADFGKETEKFGKEFSERLSQLEEEQKRLHLRQQSTCLKIKDISGLLLEHTENEE